MQSRKNRIRKNVMDCLDLSRELSDEEVGGVIDRCILDEAAHEYIPVKEKVRLKAEIFNSLRRLDVLTEYFEAEDITEIMVNGYRDIFVERNGRLERADSTFESEEKLLSVIQQIVAGCNRRINEAEPIVDARLRDGSRVNIVLQPVSVDGPIVTIRRFPKEAFDMNRLIALGAVSQEVADLLGMLVVSGYNIFVSGGTGSGKTTFLNALSGYIPKSERVITIEDSAELQLKGIDNLVRLEARPSNVEGNNAVTIRELIKTSLRMRPDRIIVGEVRDEAAIDMLAAMNTGHDGSLSTGHANSCEDMIKRLETMVLMGLDIPLVAVKQQIASAVDVIIHLSRMYDGSRKVWKICEVVGMKNGEIRLNTLFEINDYHNALNNARGMFRKVNDLMNVDKLLRAGMLEVYQDVQREI